MLSIPPNYYPGIPTPVILSYHGGTKTAEDQLELDQLTNPEFNTDAIVVYPQGIDVSQFERHCLGYDSYAIIECPCLKRLPFTDPTIYYRINGKAFQV